jgi:hypothetical protein
LKINVQRGNIMINYWLDTMIGELSEQDKPYLLRKTINELELEEFRDKKHMILRSVQEGYKEGFKDAIKFIVSGLQEEQ